MYSRQVTPLRDRNLTEEASNSPTTSPEEDVWLLSPDDLRNKRLTPARIPKPKTRTTPLGNASPCQSKNQLGEPRAALQALNRSTPGWYDLQASLKKSAPPPSRPAQTRAAVASGVGWRGAMAGYGVLPGPLSPPPAEAVQLTPPQPQQQQPSRIRPARATCPAGCGMS